MNISNNTLLLSFFAVSHKINQMLVRAMQGDDNDEDIGIYVEAVEELFNKVCDHDLLQQEEINDFNKWIKEIYSPKIQALINI